MSIRPALEALLAVLASADRPLATQLAAGLGRTEIERKLATLPGAVAAEVHDYFEWRNGLRPDRDREEELFPEAVMLSLDEALADYRNLVAMAQQVASQAGVPADSIWNKKWVPLFRHPAGGAYHVTIAGRVPVATAPIYAVTLQDPDAASLAFDSLTSLVRTATTWIRPAK